MPFFTRASLAVGPVALAALLVTGCGDGGATTDAQKVHQLESPAQSTPMPGPSHGPGPGAGEPDQNQETPMDIQITIGDQTFGATLQDTPAVRDLLKQLPVTVEMTDHEGGREDRPLPGPLSLEGQPDGADPDVGDVGYYAPGNDLVFYYADRGYFHGIVVLGRMDRGAAEEIARTTGSVTMTVTAA